MDEFLSWFRKEGGTVDSSSLGLAEIVGQGRGAVALKDIPEEHVIFSIPRSLILSTNTSRLPEFLGASAWKTLQLDKGWTGLILCMMWEEAKGTSSKWGRYLDILPKSFDTPMFWNEDELKEIKGTAIEEKIGKVEAEKEYYEKLIPALQSRPDLFQTGHYSTFYSLENYHRMGSRILSRSFYVERWEGEENAKKDGEEISGTMENDIHSPGKTDSMDVDTEGERIATNDEDQEENKSEGSDDDDKEDPSCVSMLPMADMLNARYGCENAKLFYEPTELKMITTKPIKKGEQIFNTYGNPPNSDLLRRYGHVDLVPTKDGKEGNPADVVELSASLVLEVVLEQKLRNDKFTLEERIDWWLEEGGDDVFILDKEHDLSELVSFIRLLLLTKPEWEKAQQKGSPPKPRMDLEILQLSEMSLDRRIKMYPTSLEFDEQLISAPNTGLSNNLRNSLIVRIGEKRILMGCVEQIKATRRQITESLSNKTDRNGSQKKRKRDEGDNRSKKKQAK